MDVYGTQSDVPEGDAPVLVRDDGPVRRIWFNRPEVHNAQNVALLEALDDVVIRTSRERDVRVVVLAGVGRSFCSGHDLREMAVNAEYAANAASAEGRYRQEQRLFMDPVVRFRRLPVPTVCRVQGHCLAAGMMFTGAADFVVASENAVFGSPIVRNLAVNDAEVLTYASRLGELRAKRLLWLDERMDATEALGQGFVSWVVPEAALDDKVDRVVTGLLGTPSEATSLSKATFQFAADAAGERLVTDFHFVNHQLSHHTDEAHSLLRDRMSRVADGRSVVSRDGG